jgi:PPP family 3-phenylpropionic acid transporter
VHAIALAPTTNIADALAVTAARRQGWEYGSARGAGSAAFIVASVLAGVAVSRFAIDVTVVLQAALMLTVPMILWFVPPVLASRLAEPVELDSIRSLLGLAIFRRVVAAAALILGSHALHDTFSVIRWTNAGISAQTASMLWSLAVAAEVFVFFLAGPWLLKRLSPAHAIAIAAVAGALRWLVSALTLDLAAIALIQPLHGVTFALLHLACMRLLAENVPSHFAATAQAVYGTLGVGANSALVTIASGWLYGAVGPAAFFVMAAICLAALPVALSMRAVAARPRQPSASTHPTPLL